ncbi:YwbE family protein [Carboxylicivirga taeanensis]|uniref:YwbE family protein n=1 Tax=Carboxylicivirga taeanensis TaxID=1416875 RepID=UPI003F6DD6D6
MDNNYRDNIRQGAQVSIVLKQHQRSGQLTEGVVKDILTKSKFHPHGIKVRLEDGQVGRVKRLHQ